MKTNKLNYGFLVTWYIILTITLLVFGVGFCNYHNINGLAEFIFLTLVICPHAIIGNIVLKIISDNYKRRDI